MGRRFFQHQKLPRFPKQLTESQLKDYRKNGFLALRGFLSRWEVARAKQAISQVIRWHVERPEIAKFVAGQESGPGGRSARFQSRHSDFYFQLEPGWTSENPDWREVERWTSKLMNYHLEHPRLRRIGLENLKLLRVLGQILGDFAVLYQSVAFIKPALVGSRKGWHQDNAYFRMQRLDQVLGVWIALDPATAKNGCMHVLPRGHKRGPLLHDFIDDCEIAKDRIDPAQAVAVEMDPGDILIFHGNLPHMTPANTSPQRRRALQFHYRSEGNPLLNFGEYEKVFKEPDGTPATCAAAHARKI